MVQATLEEVCEADLLLHVLDASSPSVADQRQAVLQVCFCLHTCLPDNLACHGNGIVSPVGFPVCNQWDPAWFT